MKVSYKGFLVDPINNIIGDELLLNFGAKFQRYFVISHVKLQRAQKDALENLNTQENIKKDSNRYFAEKVWEILNFISQI